MNRNPIAAGRRQMLASAGALASLGLAGCSISPADGPRTASFEDGARQAIGQQQPFVLVHLSDANVQAVGAAQPGEPQEILAAALPRGSQVGMIGPGDMLHVNLWEPNATGASMMNQPGLDLNVRVDGDGTITVPYVGRVAAGWRKPQQVEAALRGSLASGGRDMQAAVLVTDDVTNAVILQGEVGKPGRYPLNGGARGLLDVLAMAGGVGPKASVQSADVRITRGGTTVAVNLARLAANPSADIALSPGDRIMVLPRSRYFYAFGAVNHPGEQPFDLSDYSLAHALARLSGLSSSRANPNGVFVYRRQAADTTRGIAGSGLRPDQDATKAVYHLDLRDPHGYFVAQQFQVRPEDIIYVSPAPLAEALQTMQLIAGMNSVASIPRNLGLP